jgi:hypothetical protein
MEAAPIVLKDSMKIMEFVWVVQMDKFIMIVYKDVFVIKLLIYIGMGKYVHYVHIHNTGIMETWNVRTVNHNKYITF